MTKAKKKRYHYSCPKCGSVDLNVLKFLAACRHCGFTQMKKKFRGLSGQIEVDRPMEYGRVLKTPTD